MRMLNPQNLNMAFGLAKIQEEYLPASKKIRPWNDNRKGLIFGPPPLIRNEAMGAKLPIQKLSPSQVEERKKKGLCFHCDDKWVVGHQCETPRVFLLEGLQQQLTCSYEVDPKDESVEEVSDHLESSQAIVEGTVEITLYALLGSPSPGTMRVWGRINNQEMIILIDSGSTHNFLDVSMWMSLLLPLSTADYFEVKVANGATLRTKGACHEVPLKIQGTNFLLDLNVLVLGG